MAPQETANPGPFFLKPILGPGRNLLWAVVLLIMYCRQVGILAVVLARSSSTLHADEAWVVDLGISNTHYNSNNREANIQLSNLPYLDRSGEFGIGVNRSITLNPTVGIISLNTTFVNLSGGKEYYLRGDAFNKDNSWRIGGDVGGRYGSAKTEFVGFPNLKDTVGAVFLSIHSDLQIPFGKVNLIAGLRLEWDYIWNDVLQSQNNSDLSNISLLYNGGIQF